MDKYFRKDAKWAKVSGSRGRWTVALGWRGEFQATRVQKAHTKLLATVIGQNWVADQ